MPKVERVGNVNTKGRSYFVNLKFGYGNDIHTELKCQVDTGTICNLMSFKDACAIAQMAELTS